MPPIPDTLFKGEPVQIVTTSDDHLFEFNEEALANILCDDAVKDKKICVLSLACASRNGNSLILDFFLRYLARKGATDWLGKDDEPLTGFSSRGVSGREKTGIWAWNKLFICKLVEGEEIAVMLLDTQGISDTESTVKDLVTVFALSTMVSSVQTFNLSQNMKKDAVYHLQLFTEYGRLALEKEEVKEKPFQCLLFLVHDWSYPYEYAYGEAGGQHILDRNLDESIFLAIFQLHKELQEVREHIRSCFEKIRCFLMPPTGLSVARQKEYDVTLADIDSEFQDYLKVLAPMLLAPSNLIVKSINGSHVRCKDLLECFKAYVNIYQNIELPQPKTMLRATSKANNLVAVALALDQYEKEIDKVCGGDKPYIGPEDLEKNHQMILAVALKTFEVIPKMGGLELNDMYKENLIKDIEDRRAHYEKNNEIKNLLNITRTPVNLVVTMVIMYVLSGIFGILGLYSLSNLAKLVLGISVIALMAWCHGRYTVEYLHIGVTMAILYMRSGSFGIMGAYPLSNLASLVLSTPFMALMVWWYVCDTGQYFSIGVAIPIMSEISRSFGILGVDTLSILANLVQGTSVMVLMVWCYGRYTEQYLRIGVAMVMMHMLYGLFGLSGVYILSISANLVLVTSVMASMVWCYVLYTGQYFSIGGFVNSQESQRRWQGDCQRR